MKIIAIASALLIVPSAALAQNPSQAVVAQFSSRYGGTGLSYVPNSPYTGLRFSSGVTPTMIRQADQRALALREQINVWIAEDSGSLSRDHQREVSKEARAIRSLLGYSR